MNEVIPASSQMEGAVTVPLPLLLLPGTVCDARLFAPLLKRLALPVTRVIDMTGEATTPDLARRILPEAPERFSLLGFSLGGIVALEMVAQAPERVARLALVDTTPCSDPAANADKRRAAVARARAEGMDGYILDAWCNLVAPSNVDDADLQALITAMARDAGPDVLASQSEVAIHRLDSRPRLGAIKVPTLVLAGEAPSGLPARRMREMADGIPGARFFTIPEPGISPRLKIRPQWRVMCATGWIGPTRPSHSGRPRERYERRDQATPSQGRLGARRADKKPCCRWSAATIRTWRRPTAPRSQPLEGFDDIYTDIVDYIIRCTHKIWDERDIGLIYTHYTHNCVLYGTTGTIYNREDVVRDTIQRLVSFPERRGMGTQVIWNGNDQDGFYTSHLVTGSGGDTQYGHLGQPTGRPFVRARSPTA